jgi:hypothetical protein
VVVTIVSTTVAGSNSSCSCSSSGRCGSCSSSGVAAATVVGTFYVQMLRHADRCSVQVLQYKAYQHKSTSISLIEV